MYFHCTIPIFCLPFWHRFYTLESHFKTCSRLSRVSSSATSQGSDTTYHFVCSHKALLLRDKAPKDYVFSEQGSADTAASEVTLFRAVLR